MQKNSINHFVLVFLGLFSAVNADALNYQYSFFGNTERSDNILRSETDEQSSTIYNAGVTFGLESTESSVLQTNFSGLLGRTFYSGDDFDDENLRGFEGGLLYTPAGTNFSVAVVDSYSQIQQNRFVTQRIGNTTDINVFAVLPSYFVRLSGKDQINFEYLYSQVADREDQPLLATAGDVSRRVTKPAIGWEHALSKISDIALYVSQTTTKYDELTTNDYEERDLFFRLSSRHRKTTYVMDLGRAEITTDTDETFDGNLISLSLVRQLNPNDRLSFQYNQDYGSLINTDVTVGVINLNVNDQAGYIDEVLQQKSFRSQYNHDGAYIDVSVEIYKDYLEGLFSDREEDSVGGNIAIVFEHGKLMKVAKDTDFTFRIGFDKQENRNTNVENNEIYSSLRYNNYLTRSLLVFAEYRREKTEEQADLINGDFTENSILLGFSYSPLGRIKGF